MTYLSLPSLVPISAGNDLFIGEAGIDQAEGGLGMDTLSGLAGNDVLSGGDGDDSLLGGDGDDLLFGGAGNDVLIGGAGFDMVSYQTATAAVRVRLLTFAAQTTGGAGRDVLTGIEGLVGGAFGDILTGDQFANLLDGGAGNDVLDGGVGNDTLVGGLGNDVIDGGRDSDTADYSGNSGNLTISLATTTTQNTVGAGVDQLISIEHLIGGVGNDRLTGHTLGNRLQGGLGDDTLDGGAGGDTLLGGGGNDNYFVDAATDEVIEDDRAGTDTVTATISYTLAANVENLVMAEIAGALEGIGNAGANHLRGNAFNNVIYGVGGEDTLWGGGGNDTLHGGIGHDIATYADATVGLGLRLDTAAAQAVGLFGSDVLISIEGLVGGSGNDTLTGDLNSNTLYGGIGRDMLAGQAGQDRLDGGAGDDSLSGGDGDDDLIGDLGNDTLTGGEGYNTLAGGLGDDVVIYVQGRDDVSVIWLAQDNAFWIVTDNSTDFVSDMERFSFAGAILDAAYLKAVRLTAGADDEVATELGGQIYGLDGNDTLVGAGGVDSLDGGGGNDVIDGAGGADLLIGGAGDDRIYAGIGNDTVDGGAGTDTLFLSDGFASWTITLANDIYTLVGQSGRVTASGIEAIYCGADLTTNHLPLLASLTSADRQTTEGSSGTSTIQFTVTLDRTAATSITLEYAVAAVTTSVNSSDFVTAGQMPAGVVTILAGQRTATFTLQIATDADFEVAETFSVTLKNPPAGLILQQASTLVTILNDDMQFLTGANDVYVGTAGADLVDGQFGNDSLSGLGGADLLTGGAGRDTIYGGIDNDTLVGGVGDDQLYGDAGVDTVSFEGNSTGVDASLGLSLARSAQDGTDRLFAIENLIGGSGNDTLIGDTGANQLFGMAGNDRLDGAAGSDAMAGGAGNDTYCIDVAGDTAVEASDQGVDRIISVISYTLSSNVEELELAGAAVIDGTGNVLDNLLMGNRRENQLLGEAGNDRLLGEDGNDTLFGGSGSDRLTGGSGADRLFGGLGNDTLSADQADLVLDGGENTDVLELGARYVSMNDSHIANIEVVTLTKANVVLHLTRQTEGFTLNGFVSGASTIVGGAGADTVVGGSGADSLSGGGGADSLIGGLGNDTMVGDQSDVFFDGGVGIDVLQFGANFAASSDAQIINIQVVTLTAAGLVLDLSNQTEGLTMNGFATGASTIIGSAGADIIFGGSGADSLMAGIGDDILIGEEADVLLDGGAGTDMLVLEASFTAIGDALIAHVEAITLAATGLSLNLSNQTENFTLNGFSTGASTITGGAGVDLLIGGIGGDSLNGGAGSDSVYAGEGNDTLIGAQADAILDGGAGTDVVQVGADWTTVGDAQLANVESVTLTATGLSLNLSNQTEGFTLNGFSTGASTITGGAGVDLLIGGIGGDSLNGGAGSDSVYAGEGNDTLIGAQADAILDGGAGTDVVQVGADWTTVGDAQLANVESVTLTATGLSLNLSNQTEGFTLNGFSTGASTITGGSGVDRIVGGSGNDSLTGGAGADSFVFGFLSGFDRISDFSPEIDLILLDKSVMTGLGVAGTLAPAAFYSADDAVSGSDESDRVIYNTATGALYYDADGSGSGLAIQIAALVGQPTLNHLDVLIF